ncbi:MAG: family 20 glycosylhydrolase [Bacilli bacterium]|nr:family 20 glycosylhydrolase [Bacilli bacterium]
MNRVGVMIDCSRNAVRNLSTVKKWIDLSKQMNFTSFSLYMEDVYSLVGEPYFGHMRGRYSASEIKEIDDYAYQQGLTFIPCIQTLAHLNQIFAWNTYKEILDCEDILLANNERTYALIDKMFSFFANNIRGRHINVGMDEAYMFSRGRYLEFNKYENATKIFFRHLKRVDEIAKKHGFTIEVWSYAIKGTTYYQDDFRKDPEIASLIPNDIHLAHWDYHSNDYKLHLNNFKKHLAITDASHISFACGVWCWAGFAPMNKLGIDRSKNAILAAHDVGINNIMITLWGDDGAECPSFASLPSVFYLSKVINGEKSSKVIKEAFFNTFKIKYDDFMKLDLPNVLDKSAPLANPCKYLLYNDPLIGLLDSVVFDGIDEVYSSYYRKLKRLVSKFNEYGYIPKMLSSLCRVLSVKASLGVKTRNAYLKKDKVALTNLIPLYKKCIKYLKEFANDFRDMWFKENKSFGLEVHELRLGGLLARLESTIVRLNKYVNGEIQRIEELEEERLPFDRAFANIHQDSKIIYTNYQLQTITACKM